MRTLGLGILSLLLVPLAAPAFAATTVEAPAQATCGFNPESLRFELGLPRGAKLELTWPQAREVIRKEDCRPAQPPQPCSMRVRSRVAYEILQRDCRPVRSGSDFFTQYEIRLGHERAEILVTSTCYEMSCRQMGEGGRWEHYDNRHNCEAAPETTANELYRTLVAQGFCASP